jgi:hypothetical protein
MKRATLAVAAAVFMFTTSAAFAQDAAPTGPGTMQPIPNPPETPKHHAARHHHKHAHHHHKMASSTASKTKKAG